MPMMHFMSVLSPLLLVPRRGYVTRDRRMSDGEALRGALKRQSAERDKPVSMAASWSRIKSG